MESLVNWVYLCTGVRAEIIGEKVLMGLLPPEQYTIYNIQQPFIRERVLITSLALKFCFNSFGIIA